MHNHRSFTPVSPVMSVTSALGDVRHVLSQASAAVHTQQTLAEERRRVLRRLHRRRRHRRDERIDKEPAEAEANGTTTLQNETPFLVLGFVTNPRTPQTRAWIREFVIAPATTARAPALIRFIVGKRGLSVHDREKLDEERKSLGQDDFAEVDASDFNEAGGIYSCIDKLFAWFRHAPRAYPGATFYAKADDDSLVDVPRLASFLRPAARLPNVYAGYVQYDSLILPQWKHCGWSAGPIGAAHARAHGCPHGDGAPPVYGPFPFVVGALTIMGADLASWFAASAHIGGIVSSGRATHGKKVHWDCGYSDVTLGYALGSANRSITLVSVARAMRDATYLAMDATRFVVSHHLRSNKMFKAEAARAAAQGAWAARLGECVPWGEPTAGVDDHAELLKASGAFSCCQSWRVCELAPL